MKALGPLRRLGARLRGTARAFRRDEEGAVAIMTAAVLVGAVVIIGGAVDVYRFEMLRKRAQNTLDRGVLAASALNQSVDPEMMVRSYMKSAGLELPANAKFTIKQDKGYRSIKVETTFDLPMTFLRLANQEQWEVPVVASAEERERKVEISVVLDLSGSMADNVSGKSQRRIDALKPAAASFVRQMLDTDKEKELTSISLVPYSSNVGLGREMFDHLAGTNYDRKQHFSSCFHLKKEDFTEGLPNFKNRDQVAHWANYSHTRNYKWSNNAWKIKENEKYNEKVDGKWELDAYGWRCPADAYAWLHRNPDVYKLTDGTDPLGETLDDPIVTELKDAAHPSLKDGREVVLWSKEVWQEIGRCEKVSGQAAKACAEPKNAKMPDAADREPQDALDDGDLRYVDDFGSMTYLSNDPDYLAHRIENLPLQGHTATHIGTKYAYMLLDPAFKDKWSSFMTKKLAVGPKRPATFKERPAAWDDPNTFKYMVIMTDGRINQSYKSTTGIDVQYPGGNETGVYYAGGNKGHFESLCENAKENGVSVFTIGFDLGGSGNASTRKSMEDCASNRSQYFNVEDGDIGAAFDAIAASIQKLRLTS